MSAEGQIDELVDARFFRNQPRGTMLEIGAARPDWLSVGARFRAKGWDVLSVEPNPHFAAMHRDAGHDVAQVALSDTEHERADFTIVNCAGAAYRDGAVTFESWSSLGIRGEFAELDVPADRQTIPVRVCRADTLLREVRPEWHQIDLIAIDIEGWELEALGGLDFDRYRPSVVVLENRFVDRSYRDFMRRRGFLLYRHLFPNEVYVRDHRVSVLGHLMALLLCTPATTISRCRVALGRLKRGFAVVRHVDGKRSPVSVIRT